MDFYRWGLSYALLCPLPHTSLGRTHLDQSLMATLNSTISGSDTGDTLIGTESDQLISAGTGADSIGSQYANSSLVGGDGNDTFFANSKVPGVGVGSTLTGGGGADSFEFNSYGLTSVKLYANQDNDTIRLTGPTVETSLFGGKGEDSLQIRNTLTNSYIESNSGNDTIDVTARIENTTCTVDRVMIVSL